MYNNKNKIKVNCKIMLLKRTEDNGVVNALYESSNILASKWDGENLTVIFKRGASYTYKNVTNRDYTRFETADSQGQILNSHIKNYSFDKNDTVNEIKIINEINEAKAAELKKFEEGLIEYMKLIIDAYTLNPVLTNKSIEGLSQMIVKHNELKGDKATLKLCKCD